MLLFKIILGLGVTIGLGVGLGIVQSILNGGTSYRTELTADEKADLALQEAEAAMWMSLANMTTPKKK